MRRKSIVVTLAPIASSRPIGKAEAADCISLVEERERRTMMMTIMI